MGTIHCIVYQAGKSAVTAVLTPTRVSQPSSDQLPDSGIRPSGNSTSTMVAPYFSSLKVLMVTSFPN